VANFAASVAGLATFAVQWATVGSGAVAGDVSKLSAGIALHGLSLAIARIMVGASALVAGRSTGNTAVSAAESTLEASTRPSSATSSTGSRAALLGAVTCKMSGLATGVASSAGRTAQTQCRTVSLHMAQALTVVALLCFGRARVRAAVRFVSRLLAIVTKSLRRRANLSVMADVAALVASSAREG